MTATKALDALVEQTKEVLENAAVLLANSRRNEQQARDHLKMLETFRSDYAKERQRLMRIGMSPMTFSHYRGFLDMLDAGIFKATQMLTQFTQTVDENQTHLTEQHVKLTSFETLIDRRARSAQVAANRVEQRQVDEMSAQMRLRNGSRNGSFTPGF
ncbi:flagellar export protein FliJ [Pseudomonas serbica]|jgi:flagellar FliJ protein|uniref:flagellar export protein FliJ n=1 Tax=Pseudomonas serbica TaxID=2965074 RepID=UPI00237C3EC8|nr:flagellar export protein FliJ [Pseudomonas serbica]